MTDDLIKDLQEYREHYEVAGGVFWENPKICKQAVDTIIELRAQVAAAIEMTTGISVTDEPDISQITQHAIRKLTPADAEAALDKLLAEARLEGWRAGREAAVDEATLYSCTEGSDDFTKGIQEGYAAAVTQIVDGIRALPEPKEVDHD